MEMIHDHAHNILKLLDILANFLLTISLIISNKHGIYTNCFTNCLTTQDLGSWEIRKL